MQRFRLLLSGLRELALGLLSRGTMRSVCVRTALGLATLLVLCSASRALATNIDFTDAAAWAGVTGTSLYSSSTLYDGVTVTVTSQGPSGLLTFNSGSDVNLLCGALTSLSCQGDGLGVTDDEVTNGASLLDSSLERLYVYFSSPVNVTQIGFLDLFGFNLLTGDFAPELAMWTAFTSTGAIDGSVSGTDSFTTLGYRTTSVNYTDVNALMFYATNPPAPRNTDFSLASINISRVPEPASLLLSGIGLLGLLSVRARSRRAS